jgi:hypothetical protein
LYFLLYHFAFNYSTFLVTGQISIRRYSFFFCSLCCWAVTGKKPFLFFPPSFLLRDFIGDRQISPMVYLSYLILVWWSANSFCITLVQIAHWTYSILLKVGKPLGDSLQFSTSVSMTHVPDYCDFIEDFVNLSLNLHHLTILDKSVCSD